MDFIFQSSSALKAWSLTNSIPPGRAAVQHTHGYWPQQPVPPVSHHESRAWPQPQPSPNPCDTQAPGGVFIGDLNADLNFRCTREMEFPPSKTVKTCTGLLEYFIHKLKYKRGHFTWHFKKKTEQVKILFLPCAYKPSYMPSWILFPC